MCDTQFRIYLYSVCFGIHTCAGGYVSLGFSVVGVFKRVFGVGFFSWRVTSVVSFCFLIHVSVFFVSVRRISDQIKCLAILRVNRVLLSKSFKLFSMLSRHLLHNLI